MIKHPVFHKEAEDKDMTRYIGSNKFTPEEYQNLLANRYGIAGYTHRMDVPEWTKDHPHNTIENNDKAAQLALTQGEDDVYGKHPANVIARNYQLSQPMIRKLLESRKIDEANLANQESLTGDQAYDILSRNNSKGPLIYKLMGKISPEQRKDIHSSSIPAIEHSEYLTDDEINDIKENGNTKEKLALFNNQHVDPKHGAEMWQRWFNDDEPEYNLSDLQEHLKDKHEGDVRDYYEAAEREAEESYPINEYIRDNNIDLVRPEDVHDHMSDNEDWTGENPDFDPEEPESEDNPKTINFADHHKHSINDHPEYEDRYEKHKKQLEENAEIPDRVYEGYSDAIADDVSDIMHRNYSEDAENFHLDENRLPVHLQGHIPQIEEAEALKREKERKELHSFLGQHMPNNIQETHEYGDGQHHLEMAKDYADKNNGKIDLGTLIKNHPNLKEKWQGIFKNKGSLTSPEIQEQIDNLPKTKYAITHGKWGEKNMQNINGQNQIIFRLDHTPDSMAPIKNDPNALEVYDEIHDVAQRSGHPTNTNTIAWSRVDATNPKHWMIDELQSDFSSAAREFLEQNGAGEKAKAVDTIIGHHKNWREALLNHVIKAAKANGVEKISTHSPESKAAHTGADTVHSVYKDSYQKVPRQLGFKPETNLDNLPLNEKGRFSFQKAKAKDSSANFDNHLEALAHHHGLALAHGNLALKNPEHNELKELHSSLARKHEKAALQIDPSASSLIRKKYKEISTGNLPLEEGAKEHAEQNPLRHKADALLNQPESVAVNHPGHTLDLRSSVLKKIESLMKSIASILSKK